MKRLALLVGLLVNTHAYSGVLLVVNKSSHSLSILDPERPEYQASVDLGPHPHEAAVSEDGSIAVVSQYGSDIKPGNSLYIVDVKKASLLSTVYLEKKARPHGIAFLNQDEVLVTAEGVQSVFLVNIKHSEILKKIKLPGRGAHLVEVDPERKFAYISNNQSGSLVKLNLSTFQVEAEVQAGSGAEGLALLPSTHRIVVTSRKDNKARVFNTDDMSLIKEIATAAGPIRARAFHNESKTLISNAVGGKIQIIDNQSLEIVKTFKSSNSFSLENGKNFGGFFGALPVPITPSIDEAHSTVWIANSFAGKITKIDLETGAILESFEAEKEPDGLTMSSLTLTDLPLKRIPSSSKSPAIEIDTLIHTDNIESVWATMTDVESYDEWNPWIPELKGELRDGAVLKATVKLGGLTLHTKHLITRMEAPHTLCWRDVSWFAFATTGSRCRHLKLVDGNVLLQNRFEFEGALQKPTDWLLRSSLEKGMLSENEGMKSYLER